MTKRPNSCIRFDSKHIRWLKSLPDDWFPRDCPRHAQPRIDFLLCFIRSLPQDTLGQRLSDFKVHRENYLEKLSLIDDGMTSLSEHSNHSGSEPQSQEKNAPTGADRTSAPKLPEGPEENISGEKP